MRSGRWSIFRRARLLSLLKSSLPFKHWSMDMLVKLAYAMKKKVFDTGNVIIQQGDRIEHLWIIADGKVRISHNVIPPSSIDTLRSGGSNVRGRNRQPKQPITVDVADLFERDCIGLIESMEESTTTKKSERDAIAMCTTEMFFVPLTFFKSFLAQDAKTLAIIEQVVERRKKWAYLRRDYAIKFPNMSMKLPRDVESMSLYAISSSSVKHRGSSNKSKSALPKQEEHISVKSTGRLKADSLIERQSRAKTLELLSSEAGLSSSTGTGNT